MSDHVMELARAYFLRAIDEQESGNLVSAEALLRQARALVPERESVLVNLASVLFAQGQLEEAKELALSALRVNPVNVQALLCCGHCAQVAGNADEALQYFDAVLAIDGQSVIALIASARLMHGKGLGHSAMRHAELAVALAPEEADAWCVLGGVLSGLNRLQESLVAYRRALALRPDWDDLLMDAGNASLAVGEYELGVDLFLRGVRLSPERTDLLHNLGQAYALCGKYALALEAYEQVLALRPTAMTLWNRAHVRLAQGDYVEGFADYEARWHTGMQPMHKALGPQWKGEPIAGKRLMIHAEQGYGDMIMFSRFLPMLAELGAQVQIGVPKALLPIMRETEGVERVCGGWHEVLPYDVHCPIMSLPGCLGVSLDRLPSSIPYISVPSAYQDKWRTRSVDGAAAKIGFVWSCSEHGSYSRRSMPLQVLCSLWGLFQNLTVFCVSLQNEYSQTDLNELKRQPWLNDVSAELKDFGDTAALIQTLDLVVTVDTAVAHLAGSLGKAVWVLLPYVSDWRWLIDRADSPWYPSARLFRQPAHGAWGRLMDEQVKPELERWLDTKRAQ